MAVITEHKKILIKNKRPFYGNTVKGPIVLIIAAGVYLSCQSSNAFLQKGLYLIILKRRITYLFHLRHNLQRNHTLSSYSKISPQDIRHIRPDYGL